MTVSCPHQQVQVRGVEPSALSTSTSPGGRGRIFPAGRRQE